MRAGRPDNLRTTLATTPLFRDADGTDHAIGPLQAALIRAVLRAAAGQEQP